MQPSASSLSLASGKIDGLIFPKKLKFLCTRLCDMVPIFYQCPHSCPVSEQLCE